MLSKRMLAIIRKEFIHIFRDFRTLIIIFAMPVFMLFMYGYAINMELQHIELAMVDYSASPESRALIRDFQGSRYFTVSGFEGNTGEIDALFMHRKAMAAIIIPHDFATTAARQPAKLQILVDASDSNTAQIINNYINGILTGYNLSHGIRPAFEVSIDIRYNPTLKSTYFFVPGLMALILIMISALLTSIAIAREKETGTMEQILVSPIRPFEIIIGKVIPYIVMAFADGLIILVVANIWFEVPVHGSLLLLLAGMLLFIFVALALGLLISTRAQTQQVAMMMALFATLLPTIMLSGFLFPIPSMPLPLQWVSKVIPATYFLEIVRGVMLKGNTLEHIGLMMGILAIMGAFLTVVSTKRFKMTL